MENSRIVNTVIGIAAGIGTFVFLYFAIREADGWWYLLGSGGCLALTIVSLVRSASWWVEDNVAPWKMWIAEKVIGWWWKR